MNINNAKFVDKATGERFRMKWMDSKAGKFYFVLEQEPIELTYAEAIKRFDLVEENKSWTSNKTESK